MRVRRFLIPIAAVCLAACLLSGADAMDRPLPQGVAAAPLSVQVMSGLLKSPFLVEPSRQDLDWAQASIRFGRPVLSEFTGRIGWTGQFETLAEFNGASVCDGAGHTLGGAGALLRYRFAKPGVRWNPYVQIGAGGVISDVYKDETQGLIGQAFEFSLQAGAGLSFHLTERWSLDIEAMFVHISNAGMSDRNVGANAGGVFFGATRRFGSLFQGHGD